MLCIFQINTLSWAQSAGWWTVVQQQITREIKIEKFITHGSWRKYLALPYEKVKAKWRQRERQDLGHMLLLGFLGRTLCGSWAKARLANSDQESRVLIGSTGVLFKRQMRGKCLEAGETVDHKGYWESHIRNLHLLMTWGFYLRNVIVWLYSLRSLQGTRLKVRCQGNERYYRVALPSSWHWGTGSTGILFLNGQLASFWL